MLPSWFQWSSLVMWQMYLAIAIPKMIYTLDIWSVSVEIFRHLRPISRDYIQSLLLVTHVTDSCCYSTLVYCCSLYVFDYCSNRLWALVLSEYRLRTCCSYPRICRALSTHFTDWLTILSCLCSHACFLFVPGIHEPVNRSRSHENMSANPIAVVFEL